MTNSDTTISFKNALGNLISEEMINAGVFVGTGMIVSVTNGIKTIDYKAIIYGDLSGEGVIDLNDLILIRNYLLESDQFNAVLKEAGDLYNEGDITLNSLVAVMAYVQETSFIRGISPVVRYARNFQIL